MRFNLLNGIINIPEDFGGYIVSTGCGSGKTRNIKSELLAKKYNEGILYCIDSKEECTNMYKWIINELISDPNIPTPGLTPDNVMMIHWDDPEEMYNYINHPSEIMNKKILILTHVRFWTDLINYFLIYNPKSPVDVFDGDFTRLMQRDDLRRWIIFDETPQMLYPIGKVYKDTISTYDWVVSTFGYTNYETFFNGSYKDSDRDYNQDTELKKMKRETILKSTPGFERYIKSQTRNTSNFYNLYFYPKDLIQSGMKTSIYIFEGAGDILFSTPLDRSKTYQLIDVPNKYNSLVQFHGSNHRFKKTTTTLGDLDSAEFNAYLDNICNVINTHQRTLIVTWKYIGKRESPLMNDFHNYIRAELNKRIPYDPNKYEVTYFGASNTKSTNDFMNCDAIVLMSDWDPYVVKKGHIDEGDGRDQIEKLTEAYLYDINEDNLKLWYFIQLISRIGLRLHNGKVYDVFYSNINSTFIKTLDRYFNANVPLALKDPRRIREQIEDTLKGYVKHPTTRDNIMKLVDNNSSLGTCIIDNNRNNIVEFDITLDEIHSILNFSEKKAERYKTIVENLMNVGIKLNILSNKNK